MAKRVVVQFPGLGGYVPGVLAKLAESVVVAEVLGEVDRAAREYGLEPVSGLLTGTEGPSIEELAARPALLHLSAIAASTVLYEEMRARGRAGDVLLGSSTGELTALVAAGCLSVYDAARVVCEREAALAAGDFAGGLTALRTGRGRAAHLCGAVAGLTLVPSLFNAPEQTVVSGREEELVRLERTAQAAGVQATRLLVVYPHHNPVLAPAARRLAETTAGYRLQDPAIAVYSPILGRFVRDAADVRGVIDRHLTDPVHYVEAVRHLHADYGVGSFVEAGACRILTELARECLPSGVDLVGPPSGSRDGEEILTALTQSVAPGSAGPVRPGPVLARPESGRGAVAAPAPAPTVASPAAPVTASGLPEEQRLLEEVRQVYADVLQYPVEVFTDDAELEAELGVSSLKQTQILVELLDRYDLPTPGADRRIASYRTIPQVVGLLRELEAQR